jgi:hypothetical protein
MLSIGAKCSIVAAGKPPAVTNEGGAAQLSTAGATPKVHMSWAPSTTWMGMMISLRPVGAYTCGLRQ